MVFQLHLETETVEQAFLIEPICVTPDVSIRETLQHLKRRRVGSALVCREGSLVGIFTERDAIRLFASSADLDRPIESVMTPHPTTISARDTVQAAITKMSQGGYRRLPVVDSEGHPVGLLKVTEILHYLVQHFPAFVYNLPPTHVRTAQEREGA